MWNSEAYRLLGSEVAPTDDALASITALEQRIQSRLPTAVSEWFVHGGAHRLRERSQSSSGNTITTHADVDGPDVLAFLKSGYLLLETDSQHCCRWVTPWRTVEDDPPVYLIDPDDHSCESRSRYAEAFSAYVCAQAWDASLWSNEAALTDFDHQ